MAKVAQRQILATITPSTQGNTQFGTVTPPKFETGNAPFQFAQVSGGEITASVEKIYEGGSARPTVLCAPSEIGDITLTAHYDDDMTSADTAAGIGMELFTPP